MADKRTKNNVIIFALGAVLIGYTLLAQSGALTGVMKYLHTSKSIDMQIILGWTFGLIAVGVGVINSIRTPGNTKFDHFVLAPLPGIIMIMLLAMGIRWYLEPLVKIMSHALEPTLGFKIYKVLNLNYVVLGILVGIVITNTIGIPGFAASGVKTARFVLKMGVIMLGARYSFAELAKLGAYSVWMIGFFVLGTVFMVIWLGNIFKQPKTMTGVLSAGMGVCGVSATVAVAPVVKARCEEMAYTIGTILAWGILCMFLFPTIGHIVGMGATQFGAWAGTGILNSAQVAAACLAFNSVDINTLKVGEIFNITRVLFLPIIVLVLATWYGKEVGQKLNFKTVVIDKFPIFILGFLLLFLMSSVGLFSPPVHYKGKFVDYSFNKRTEITSEEWETLDKALKSGAITGLTAEQMEAVTNLHKQRQIAGNFEDRDNKKLFDSQGAKRSKQLESIIAAAKAKQIQMDEKVAGVLSHAVKQTHKKSKTVSALTDAMIWFFAYGLIGLGMQITRKAITQAGSWPLVIGVISGITKAVLSFLVVVWFVKDVVLHD